MQVAIELDETGAIRIIVDALRGLSDAIAVLVKEISQLTVEWTHASGAQEKREA